MPLALSALRPGLDAGDLYPNRTLRSHLAGAIPEAQALREATAFEAGHVSGQAVPAGSSTPVSAPAAIGSTGAVSAAATAAAAASFALAAASSPAAAPAGVPVSTIPAMSVTQPVGQPAGEMHLPHADMHQDDPYDPLVAWRKLRMLY